MANEELHGQMSYLLNHNPFNRARDGSTRWKNICCYCRQTPQSVNQDADTFFRGYCKEGTIFNAKFNGTHVGSFFDRDSLEVLITLASSKEPIMESEFFRLLKGPYRDLIPTAVDLTKRGFVRKFKEPGRKPDRKANNGVTIFYRLNAEGYRILQGVVERAQDLFVG